MENNFKNKLLLLPILFFTLVSENSFANPPFSLVLNYLGKYEDCRELEENLYFCGSEEYLQRMYGWMEDIRRTSIGLETLFAIKKSGRRLLVMHDVFAVTTAGKALAPLSFSLTNGIGSDVVVQMHFDMPEEGSHLVTDSRGELIPFTAVVNFFHELSHARHKMNGTLLMINIEGQAVADENIYRTESAVVLGMLEAPLRDLRYTDKDERVWYPHHR